MALLDERIHRELLDLYQELLAKGELRVGADLQRCYDTFRNKFGPERLRDLDGEELLDALHGPGKDSLEYWLERKNDDEFPSEFGSISGGSAFKFGLFLKRDTGTWTTGSPQNQVMLTRRQAIEKARQQRDQLLAGVALLESIPGQGTDEDYEYLQLEMERVAPDVSNAAWGHKYFSLLFPDKLDDYHVTDYQWFHLVRLLQIPPSIEGRYAAAGRYMAIARELEIAVNTLTRLLNQRNGDPYRYWRIGTKSWRAGDDFWAQMLARDHCAIGWAEVEDLSALTNNDEGRQELRAKLQTTYTDKASSEIGRMSRQLTDFLWSIADNDLVLASDGGTVLGIGRVKGDYFYNPDSAFPHRRPVEWLALQSWKQPDQTPDIEGKLTTVYRMKRVQNLIEAERRILDARYDPQLRQKPEPRDSIATEGLPVTDVEQPEPQPHIVLAPDQRVSEPVVEEQFDDEKLVPVPEPRLTRLIAELCRHVLVDASLVRRIYHALLNGHVILTGPPGTGKTELARLIPEILWRSEEQVTDVQDDEKNARHWQTETAYATTLVTATSEWSTRTLISSIAPIISDTGIAYRTQYGHLTEAILRNWMMATESSTNWQFAKRRFVQHGAMRYRGHWLIIDEFNRAPIDTALGEALTALGNGESLLVPIDGASVRVPLPQDFRIIGTLNSFDRNYLNQISEALKRRFAFIEILPPTRQYRQQEQGIVLYKALKDLAHLSDRAIQLDADGTLRWSDTLIVSADANGTYSCAWDEQHPLYQILYQVAWPLLEVIRVYRQLGTAQVIALVRQFLTPGLLDRYSTTEQWLQALDIAFCDIIADQLQVLLPDEIDVLVWYLRLDAESFAERYNAFLLSLVAKPRRLIAHLEALGRIVEPEYGQLLTDEEVEDLLEQEEPSIPADILHLAFHLDHPVYGLPQFVRRLRAYKAEHGL